MEKLNQIGQFLLEKGTILLELAKIKCAEFAEWFQTLSRQNQYLIIFSAVVIWLFIIFQYLRNRTAKKTVKVHKRTIATLKKLIESNKSLDALTTENSGLRQKLDAANETIKQKEKEIHDLKHPKPKPEPEEEIVKGDKVRIRKGSKFYHQYPDKVGEVMEDFGESTLKGEPAAYVCFEDEDRARVYRKMDLELAEAKSEEEPEEPEQQLSIVEQIIQDLQESDRLSAKARISIVESENILLTDLIKILKVAIGKGKTEETVARRICEYVDVLPLLDLVKLLDFSDQKNSTGAAKELFSEKLRSIDFDVLGNFSKWFNAYTNSDSNKGARKILINLLASVAERIIDSKNIGWCLEALRQVGEDSEPGKIILNILVVIDSGFDGWVMAINASKEDSRLRIIGVEKIIEKVTNHKEFLRVRKIVGPRHALYNSLVKKFGNFPPISNPGELFELLGELDPNTEEASIIIHDICKRVQNSLDLYLRLIKIVGEENRSGERILGLFSDFTAGFFGEWRNTLKEAVENGYVKLQVICLRKMACVFEHVNEFIEIYNALINSKLEQGVENEFCELARDTLKKNDPSYDDLKQILDDNICRKGSFLEEFCIKLMIKESDTIEKLLNGPYVRTDPEKTRNANTLFPVMRDKIKIFDSHFEKWEQTHKWAKNNSHKNLEKLAAEKMAESFKTPSQALKAYNASPSDSQERAEIRKAIEDIDADYDAWNSALSTASNYNWPNLYYIIVKKMLSASKTAQEWKNAYGKLNSNDDRIEVINSIESDKFSGEEALEIYNSLSLSGKVHTAFLKYLAGFSTIGEWVWTKILRRAQEGSEDEQIAKSSIVEIGIAKLNNGSGTGDKS